MAFRGLYLFPNIFITLLRGLLYKNVILKSWLLVCLVVDEWSVVVDCAQRCIIKNIGVLWINLNSERRLVNKQSYWLVVRYPHTKIISLYRVRILSYAVVNRAGRANDVTKYIIGIVFMNTIVYKMRSLVQGCRKNSLFLKLDHRSFLILVARTDILIVF